MQCDPVADFLPRAAMLGAAHRKRVDRVDPDRHTNVIAFRTAAGHGIEADPAETIEVELRPPMYAIAFFSAFSEEVADGDARWNAESSRASDEDMCEIACMSASCGECLRGTGKFVMPAGGVIQPLVQSVHERVPARERR